VARVEQQAHIGAGQAHQGVDVGRRFDVGAHVVVVGQTNAFGQGELRQLAEFVGVGLPGLFGVKPRALHQRDTLTLNRVGHFAVHQHLGAVFCQQMHVAGDSVDFFGCRAAGQTAGIPARHQRQIIGAQYIADALGVLGELAVELEAFVTDLLAFSECSAQRRFAAQ